MIGARFFKRRLKTGGKAASPEEAKASPSAPKPDVTKREKYAPSNAAPVERAQDLLGRYDGGRIGFRMPLQG